MVAIHGAQGNAGRSLGNAQSGIQLLLRLALALLPPSMPMHSLLNTFVELVRMPFQHVETVWGIVPLYFGLLLNEVTSGKANFRTAIQTGFSFAWAAAQWLYPFLKLHGASPQLELRAMSPINLVVTGLVLAFGLAALICGLLGKFPKYGRFLGHTRFANYFMITIFPMQTPVQVFHLAWTWERLLAITVFAVPVWLVLHFGLMPLRGVK